MTHTEFKKLFMPLQRFFYSEAYKMLCDRFEAEDAVQSLYLKLWEQKEMLDSVVAPEAYCKKILRNICIDRWRIMKARGGDNILENDSIAENAPPEVEEKETKGFIEYFLAGLPEQQRRVMRMQMMGYTLDEIVEITGLSVVDVRVIISRLRKRFREIYYK